MKPEAHKLAADVQDVFHYPLIHLGDTDVSLATIIAFVCIIVLVFLLEIFLRRYLTRRFLQRTKFHPSMQYAIGKITGYMFIAIGFYVALKVVGIDLSSLAFIAGAVGVGLGFGLQNIISNFVSGLIILAERPISIGDRVQLGEIIGLVSKINLRSTNIVTNDNITIIVPNSDFITSKVTNWSYADPKVRIRLPIGVAYGTDPQVVRKLLLEVAAEYEHILHEPKPDVFFIGFGDSSLNFELAVWTEDMAAKPRPFRSDLNYAIERKFRENKIEIPFPQQDIHIRSGSLVTAPPSAAAPEPKLQI